MCSMCLLWLLSLGAGDDGLMTATGKGRTLNQFECAAVTILQASNGTATGK